MNQDIGSRAALLAAVEMQSTDFSQAEHAYKTLVERFPSDLNFLMHLSGQFFARSVAAGKISPAIHSFAQILRTAGIGAVQYAQRSWNNNPARWRRQLEKNPQAYKGGVQELQQIPEEWQFVGVGPKSVQSLR